MTVPAQTASQVSTANGVTTVFPYNFRILDQDDLLVQVDGVTMTVGADYTVSGVGVAGGGNVTFAVAPADQATVLRKRNMAYRREEDYQSGGDLISTEVNRDYDAAVMMIQQLDEAIARSLRVRAEYVGLVSTELPPPEEGSLLGWQADAVVNLGSTFGPADLTLRSDVASTASGKGASLVGYVARGTGAVARTQEDVNRARVDALDYFTEAERALVYAGTLADFSASIQKAIDYAETFSGTGGACVHFPAGKYGYTALTVEANNVILKADGEAYLVKMSATGNGLVVGNQVGRVFGVDIRGFQLGSSVTGTAGNLVSFINTGQCGVYGLTQTAAFGTPWIGIRVTNTSQFMFSDQQWQDCGADGVVFEDCVDLYLDNSRSDSNTLSGFVFNKVAGIYASNVTAYDNGVHGYSALNTYGSPVLTTQNQHWFMANCIGDTSGNHNWNITQLAQSRFTACWGASHRVTTVDLHGIALANCIDVELNNCTATNNNASGVVILSGCAHIRITGGGYHGNGVAAGSTHKVGIYSDNAQVTITGATCTDDLRAAIALARVQTHGIRLTGAANGVLIDNCNLAGNLTGSLDVPITANGLSVRNCYDGNANSYASDTVVVISPLAETIELTGAVDTLDIQPRWKGRKLKVGFTSTARLMDKAGGAAFALPSPAVQPGAFGTASIFFNGTNWLLESFSVNDGV